uniref:Uncharacterized protein n=4 Tax=unclassified Prevotella TaxID=2638335 RepID=A0AB33JRE1_9BACT
MILKMRLVLTAPQATLNNSNQLRNGEEKFSIMCPKYHLTPSLLNKERNGSSGMAAVISHDSNMTANWLNNNPNATKLHIR